MGFRDYSPGLNRFLARDNYNGALGDLNLGPNPFTGNRYAFTGGNPISKIENDGHCWDWLQSVCDAANDVGAAVAEGLDDIGDFFEEHGDDIGNTLLGGASVVGGALLAQLGFGVATGGVVLCGTGGGCLLGGPAVALGTAGVVTGGGLVIGGAMLVQQSLGNIFGGSSSNRSSSSNSGSSTRLFENQYPQDLAEEVATAERLGVKPVTPGTGEAQIAGSRGQCFGLEIDNNSGHYLPSLESLQIGKDAFRTIGVGF
ncbi:hypothetical protein DFJ66_2459 [Saccharothrix variisporea]|uniref:RHS repeat-associated protein n=2 Tax=Saccharothrix variisporea TaxID=543527 RepID=A0A495X6U3_9PSEU|nr:hypothetical protein DFJ66_2459 [Saccharothrix variisporea]